MTRRMVAAGVISGGTLAALTVNAANDVGWYPILVLAGAGGGLCAVTAAVMGVSGYSVVAHSKQTARAMESARARKEITQ